MGASVVRGCNSALSSNVVSSFAYRQPLLEFPRSRLVLCCREGDCKPGYQDLSLRAFSFSARLTAEVGSLGSLFGGTSKSLKRRFHRFQFCSSLPGQEQPFPTVRSRPIPKVGVPKINFCPSCGGVMEQKVPDGDEKPRAICTVCGNIHYQNPKMVVGCLVEHEGKVLLCRRSIEPSYGLWTLPAGFMELGESAPEGAARETWEEARAEVDVLAPFVQLDIPIIGQSYIIFRAKLKRLQFSPGSESLECALFRLDEIPFEQIAFSSVTITLKMYAEDLRAGRMKVHHGVIDKRPGASLSDPQGFVVRDHICC